LASALVLLLRAALALRCLDVRAGSVEVDLLGQRGDPIPEGLVYALFESLLFCGVASCVVVFWYLGVVDVEQADGLEHVVDVREGGMRRRDRRRRESCDRHRRAIDDERNQCFDGDRRGKSLAETR